MRSSAGLAQALRLESGRVDGGIDMVLTPTGIAPIDPVIIVIALFAECGCWRTGAYVEHTAGTIHEYVRSDA